MCIRDRALAVLLALEDLGNSLAAPLRCNLLQSSAAVAVWPLPWGLPRSGHGRPGRAQAAYWSRPVVRPPASINNKPKVPAEAITLCTTSASDFGWALTAGHESAAETGVLRTSTDKGTRNFFKPGNKVFGPRIAVPR